jgi:hypothetical protein
VNIINVRTTLWKILTGSAFTIMTLAKLSGSESQTHDIIDNLHVPRQHVLQQRDGPFLKGFL